MLHFCRISVLIEKNLLGKAKLSMASCSLLIIIMYKYVQSIDLELDDVVGPPNDPPVDEVDKEFTLVSRCSKVLIL